ncbi:putative alkaline serine protease AorO [Thozetella sp. PMI_491]|nr:putative alkaline serine protease AorO [Thozetella sp. PMI_491]
MRYTALVLGTAALAAAIPTTFPRPGYTAHEKRAHEPHMWTRRNAVPRDVLLPVRIGLKQANLHKGHNLLMDVSRHDSPNYGKYYTAEEVTELFAPEQETVEIVRTWLEDSGIHPGRVSQSSNKAWLAFDATTVEVEELLQTEFYFYEHDTSGDVNIATQKYHVPSHVSSHVDYITPGIRLLSTGKGHGSKARRSLQRRGFMGSNGRPSGPTIMKKLPSTITNAIAADPLANCDETVTPACIAAMYNITAATLAAPGNQLGIYETGDVYSQIDLNLFFANVFPTIPNGTHPELRGVDGGLAPTESYPSNETIFPGGESALDFQITYPIIWPQNSVLFQTDDYVYSEQTSPFFQGLFNNFLDAIDGSYCTYSYMGETGNDPKYDPTYPDSKPGGYTGELMCGVYESTNVISISYGINEYDISLAYQERQCSEFMKLGLQGVSIVVASGDSGVAGRFGQNGHLNGCLLDGSVFNPDFPGTCPYLTMAGSVYLPSGANASRDEEVATTSFGSGGGFSNLYPTPDYQAQAVDDYFNLYAPANVTALPFYETSQNHSVGANGGVYNRAGRGYPDVSAIGDNVLVYWDTEAFLIGGTSASAPVFAAVLNRINEERIAAGKSTVGFVNPTLYAHPEVFHDITVGNNAACNGKGFIASEGWDPVTGLGTPNYPAMLDLFMGLP